MLFVKQEICTGVTISIEITSDNVYADCLSCGCELQVDLVSEIDDFRTEDAICYSCLQKIASEKRCRNHRHKNKRKEHDL